MANISKLDKQTKISVLDKKSRPKHKAGFNLPPNPPKAIGSPSSFKYSLWSILEERSKFSYIIPKHTSGPVVFTMEDDNYSKWHRYSRVTWKANPITAFKAYYILNSQRKIYNKDKQIFYKDVSNSLKVFIETKTRFKR